MKKLSKPAQQIYQGHCRSQKKLKRSLMKWESRFNQLLMDWLMDMDYAKVAITKAQVDTQCSIFLAQAHRETDDLEEEDLDTGVFWEDILDALSEAYFEWNNKTVPETATVRVKVSMMIPVAGLNLDSINALNQATGGTYLKDFDTVTCLVANVERKAPVSSQRHESLEQYFEALVGDRLRNVYEVLEDDKDPTTEDKIKKHALMGSLRKKLAEWTLVYI